MIAGVRRFYAERAPHNEHCLVLIYRGKLKSGNCLEFLCNFEGTGGRDLLSDRDAYCAYALSDRQDAYPTVGSRSRFAFAPASESSLVEFHELIVGNRLSGLCHQPLVISKVVKRK